MTTTSLARRLAATALALGVALSLAACGASGGTQQTTAATEAPGASDPAAANECAEVESTLTTVRERLEGLQAKVPSDIPGAIDDVQTSIADLQTMSAGLQEGELKTHIDTIIGLGNSLVDVLTKAQAGDITLLEAAAQVATLANDLQKELDAINVYCNW